MPVRVVLVDDHVIFREGLKLLLEKNGVTVVGEAENGIQAVEMVRSCRPQLVIMDLSMPVMNGIEAAAAILQESGIPTILMTVHSEELNVRRAFEAGIRSYVLKTKAATDLMQAIHEVNRGSVYLSPGISGIVTGERPKKDPVAVDAMTPRERQALQIYADDSAARNYRGCWAPVWEPAASGLRILNRAENQKWTLN
jgi:DNA-binding NarL/FixJ family response regulator